MAAIQGPSAAGSPPSCAASWRADADARWLKHASAYTSYMLMPGTLNSEKAALSAFPHFPLTCTKVCRSRLLGWLNLDNAPGPIASICWLLCIVCRQLVSLGSHWPGAVHLQLTAHCLLEGGMISQGHKHTLLEAACRSAAVRGPMFAKSQVSRPSRISSEMIAAHTSSCQPKSPDQSFQAAAVPATLAAAAIVSLVSLATSTAEQRGQAA